MSPKLIRALAVVGTVAVVALLAVLALRGNGGSNDPVAASLTKSARATTTQARPVEASPPATRAPGVPDRAYATLREIDAGRWPDSANAPGTKGGDPWMNRAGTLPAKDAAGKAITYREWDVNPKQRGQTRDAERIVTGSDGSAWYTGDHYQTFTRMR
ncbi:ribonuclease domain-containing protein [Nocardia arthritidis]|uniref:Ribonuclease n=1 Tax=Nocardia arthritidis TaxID=228602 RepID=A0A6G9Y7W4_9NOCA|nr:ribonuclease domain-containing protein [Nocardia arthritidis]QIS09156.1 ribonuclease [Nocardia arthritidis]